MQKRWGNRRRWGAGHVGCPCCYGAGVQRWQRQVSWGWGRDSSPLSPGNVECGWHLGAYPCQLLLRSQVQGPNYCRLRGDEWLGAMKACDAQSRLSEGYHSAQDSLGKGTIMPAVSKIRRIGIIWWAIVLWLWSPDENFQCTFVFVCAGIYICVCVCVCVCVCMLYVLSLSHDSMDCNPPGFSVHGISQARIPECVAIYLLCFSCIGR